MNARPHDIEIYIRRVALLSSALVILLPASFYGLLQIKLLGAQLETVGRAKAILIENHVSRNPEHWRLDGSRPDGLNEVLRAEVLHPAQACEVGFDQDDLHRTLGIEILPHTTTRLIDDQGAVVAALFGDVRGWTIQRSFPVRVNGAVLGRLEIIDDINHILGISLLIMIACSILAAGMYWILDRVPLAALHDSHARERAELERRLDIELKLRSAQERLADADRLESVGRLAAGVAHEVKNPLAIIRLGIDYLAHQAPADDEIHQGVLEDIRDAVGRADRIIKDLLNFSRTRVQSRTLVDMNAIVENALRLTRHDLGLRRIDVRRSLQAPLPALAGDGEQLLQVFINLIVNAAQAIDHDGQITVSTRSTRIAAKAAEDGTAAEGNGEDTIEVAIRDTGPGLPPGDEARIFEPFFTTKAAGEGTGLGLAVARNIVNWHGGTLTLHNTLEGGAMACVTLKPGKESPNETDTRS